jgi:CheY-like chemotaxis protein
VGLGPLLVWADRTRLEQVLLNLAVNARDAMPDGGVLRITATWTPGPEPLDSSGATTDGWVRIAVTDTGVGMSDEVRAHAFEPFFTTKPVGVGTGLGLATVHGIVSELGGSLRIDSTPGAGTTISVEIPAVAASDAAPETPSPAAEQIDRDEAQRSAGEETVLVVEDEERLRAPLRLVLERSGFAVTLATDGADALDQLARGLAVDVVLTDVVMPRLTGLELADALATSRPALPVVFMSGYTDGQVSGSIDPARVVHKPFRASELLSALDRALASARRHLP